MASTTERATPGVEGGSSGFVSEQGQREDSNTRGGAQSKRPVVIANLATNSRETVRVALDAYRGCELVDVRVCVELTASSGVQTPTAKGVSLAVSKLPELAAAFAAAEAKARELGLIGEDAR